MFYSGICLESLDNIISNSARTARSSDRVLNPLPQPAEYETAIRYYAAVFA